MARPSHTDTAVTAECSPQDGDVAAGNLPPDALAGLTALSVPERRDALETLVVTEVRAALLMTAEDTLPYDVSYFDLGLTSLLLMEIKRRLELRLGRGINANVLFNSPTVERLLEYLADDLFADVFHPAGAAGEPAGTGPGTDALVHDVLRDLYRA